MNKRELFFLGVIVTGAVAVLLFMMLQKKEFENDEYYTYALANCDTGINGNTEKDGFAQNPSELFKYFFYADTNRLGLKNVWVNQRNDVHPPLYYLIQHMFNLVTHNFGGLKSGIFLNILYHVINILLIYEILKKLLCRTNLVLVGCGLYAFLPTVLKNVIFIRMYTLLSAFVLLLCLLFVRAVQSEKRAAKFYVCLGLVSVGGTLTHYYFLVYLFFSCIIWGILLLLSKKWKEAVWFAGTMGAAGGVSVMIFPPMLSHIFSGYRGRESFENLVSSDWVSQLLYYLKAMNYLFGGIFLGICIIMAVYFLWQGKAVHRQAVWKNDGTWKSALILFVPCILYFLIVSKIAVMNTERYISPIYGVSVILFLYGLKVFTDIMGNSTFQCMAFVCAAGIVLNNGWEEYLWSEKNSNIEMVMEMSEKYGKENACIHIYENAWKSLPSFSEFIYYQSITLIPEADQSRLDALGLEKYDHVVCFFSNGIKEERRIEILDDWIAENPQLSQYEELYRYQYSIVYYLE